MHTIKSGTAMSENPGENQTPDVENIRFVRSKNLDIPVRNYKKQNQQKELERVAVLSQSQAGSSQSTMIKSQSQSSRIYRKRPSIYKTDQATQTDM